MRRPPSAGPRRAAPAARRTGVPGAPRRQAPPLGRIGAPLRRVGVAGGDRGANPVELAVVMPVVFVLLFGSIQVAAWFVARATALNAAQSAVTAQRVQAAPAGAGEARAVAFLNAAGDWLVGWNDPGPNCVVDGGGVTCTVTGRSLSVVPGVSFPVEQRAHGTVERWTAP